MKYQCQEKAKPGRLARDNTNFIHALRSRIVKSGNQFNDHVFRNFVEENWNKNSTLFWNQWQCVQKVCLRSLKYKSHLFWNQNIRHSSQDAPMSSIWQQGCYRTLLVILTKRGSLCLCLTVTKTCPNVLGRPEETFLHFLGATRLYFWGALCKEVLSSVPISLTF